MELETSAAIAAEQFHHYDRHLTAKDRMGESGPHDQVLLYLVQVLTWLYRDHAAYVARNINVYTRRDRMQYPIEPDVALFEGVQLNLPAIRRMRSWRTYEPGRPPPTFVFEAASDKTWRKDLHEKPAIYAALGVTEYCLYDPNDPQYLPDAPLRLWRRAGEALLPVSPAPDGRVWSEVLASWLVADRLYVRLTDAAGQRRLTAGEAEGRRADTERRRADAAQRQAEAAQRQAEAAQRQADAERTRAEAAQANADAERAWAEAARAKLRELGIDPDTLL